MATSLVSCSLPHLPQSHLGGQVTFIHGVYCPPNHPNAQAHTNTHEHTLQTGSFYVFTYFLLQKPKPVGTAPAIPKKVHRRESPEAGHSGASCSPSFQSSRPALTGSKAGGTRVRSCAPLQRGGGRVTMNSQNGELLPLGKLSGNT